MLPIGYSLRLTYKGTKLILPKTIGNGLPAVYLRSTRNALVARGHGKYGIESGYMHTEPDHPTSIPVNEHHNTPEQEQNH